jgi:hypothetical protein
MVATIQAAEAARERGDNGGGMRRAHADADAAAAADATVSGPVDD